MESITEKVQRIIANQLGMRPHEVITTASFMDLNVDDMCKIELIMEFQEEFNVTIPDDTVKKLQTVGDAIDLIKWLSR